MDCWYCCCCCFYYIYLEGTWTVSTVVNANAVVVVDIYTLGVVPAFYMGTWTVGTVVVAVAEDVVVGWGLDEPHLARAIPPHNIRS